MGSVFHETYLHYLDELKKINLKSAADKLRLAFVNNGVKIPFYNRIYNVSVEGVNDSSGVDATFVVKVILCKYLLMSSESSNIDAAEWVTYRDFKDSGPLHSYFIENTSKTIVSQFDNNRELLKVKCEQTGGSEADFEGYDLSFHFLVLPKIPLVLNFNCSDEMFPASCSLLFRKDAEQYLDMECLAIAGTYLAGELVSN